ncbi:hypothetical protein NQ318_002911 [Aromia moschata]|uniref:Uncharacterized protein n=1 Tax=Aromia moschata TaxID=1265417 RepID=A0AAV8X795_9CUCU|nr:hypothetical protein NQ318_002911 [Aromia moschata]
MTTLLPKSRYVIHYRSLQRCLDRGLKITKIHRILKIQLNCMAQKLMNNCVFGKCLQLVRKYKDVKLVTRWEGRFGAKYYIATKFPQLNSIR